MAQSAVTTSYPADLPQDVFWNCRLDEYGTKLNTESPRLLEKDPNAAVDFIDLDCPTTG
jgi:hypothetical protein